MVMQDSKGLPRALNKVETTGLAQPCGLSLFKQFLPLTDKSISETLKPNCFSKAFVFSPPEPTYPSPAEPGKVSVPGSLAQGWGKPAFSRKKLNSQ